MEIFLIVSLVFFAVFLANFMNKSSKNSKEKKIDINKLDDFMLELREYPPELEFQTLLEYIKKENDPIIVEKIEKRLYYFITAFPKVALRKFIFFEDWNINSNWKEILWEIGFSLVFSLADFYVDEIDNETARIRVFELLEHFGSGGVKKFLNYIENEKEIPEVFIQHFEDDRDMLRKKYDL
ncbi:hypothetical protein JXR93_06590 [bacterium]|nr:hypothetical protein [bacterium]